MDDKEMEERFCAIALAVMHNKIDLARQIFNKTVHAACEKPPASGPVAFPPPPAGR